MIRDLGPCHPQIEFIGFDRQAQQKIADDALSLAFDSSRLEYQVVENAKILHPIKQGVAQLDGGCFDQNMLEIPFAKHGRRGLHISGHHSKDRQHKPNRVIDEAVFGGFLFGGYGHIILESLSRCWALRDFPNHNFIFLHQDGEGKSFDFFFDIAEKFGFKRDQIIVTDEDILCRKLIVPEPGIILGESLKIEYFDYLRAAFSHWVPEPADRSASGLYLTRSQLSERYRKPIGETKLEGKLAAIGWEIVAPESLSITKQSELFNSFNTISGFIGSQFHNMIFRTSQNPIDVVYFCNEMPNLNFLQIDAMFPGRRIYCNVSVYAPLFYFGSAAPSLIGFPRIGKAMSKLGIDEDIFSDLKHEPEDREKYLNAWFFNFFRAKAFKNFKLKNDKTEQQKQDMLFQQCQKIREMNLGPAASRIACQQFLRVAGRIGEEKPDMIKKSLEILSEKA